MKKAEKDNLYIKRVIEENKPFFIGRIAGIELKVAHNVIKDELLDVASDLMELENNAGIFIKDNTSLHIYVTQLLKAYDNCTVIAEWDISGKVFSLTGQGQRLISEKTTNIPKIDALSLEPYYFKDNWMSSLKNKKILIVHPFVKTIEKQILNLKNIFPKKLWFEGCNIKCIQPPLTLAGNHENRDWKEHYNDFIAHLKEFKDFDIALVAAGGYGMLISDYIYKEMNKSVMYIGGALQLFFGIIGKRWFENKEILKMVNDEWIRPDKDDKPSNFTLVERGCYW